MIESSRGCPYSCVFCSVNSEHRVRPPEKVCDEIEYFNEMFGVKHFMFCDPIFAFPKAWGLRLLTCMIKRGIRKKIEWNCETRADTIDDEIAEALREAGCTGVGLGIETGDDELMRGINKELTVNACRRAVGSLKRVGIGVLGLFTIGNPGETKEATLRTIEFAKELKIEGAKFSTVVPYPGTELWRRYLDGRKFSDEDWDRFSPYTSCPPYRMEWTEISPKELVKIQTKTHILFYISPRRFFGLLRSRRFEIFKICFRVIAYIMGSKRTP
jgi:radical SAM superfamily enzyme YgiQ (UPF0313 family)